MEQRGGTLAYQRARPRRSKRHRERIRHERPLGVVTEFNPYGMSRGELGTITLVPDSVYRNRAMMLGGLIVLGGLGLGLLAAKIDLDDEV